MPTMEKIDNTEIMSDAIHPSKRDEKIISMKYVITPISLTPELVKAINVIPAYVTRIVIKDAK